MGRLAVIGSRGVTKTRTKKHRRVQASIVRMHFRRVGFERQQQPHDTIVRYNAVDQMRTADRDYVDPWGHIGVVQVVKGITFRVRNTALVDCYDIYPYV